MGAGGLERKPKSGLKTANSANRVAQKRRWLETLEPRLLCSTLPTDPNFQYQSWATQVNLPKAWDYGTGSSSNIVVVMSDGLNVTHPDLATNIWNNSLENPAVATNFTGRSGVDDDYNGYVDDKHGWNVVSASGDPTSGYSGGENLSIGSNGTPIAGIIGAVANNGQGIAGVNWNVKIAGVDIGSSSDPVTQLTRASAGYRYVLAMKKKGAQVVAVQLDLTSIIGQTASMNEVELGQVSRAASDLAKAIDAAGSQGIVTVVGAGDDGINVNGNVILSAFSSSPYALIVAGVSSADSITSTSNRGDQVVSLAAPGDSVVSISSLSSSAVSETTSNAAAAIVTGAVSLLKSVKGNLDAAGLVQAILAAARPVTALQGVVKSGGRLDIGGLMAAAVVGEVAPRGYLDSTANGIVSGWAFDTNAGTSAVSVKLIIRDTNGTIVKTVSPQANVSRLDLTPVLGSAAHGFSYLIQGLAAGTYSVEARAVDTLAIGVDGPTEVSLGQAQVLISGAFGHIDSSISGYSTSLSGWAYSPLQGANPFNLRVVIDQATPQEQSFIARAGDKRSDLTSQPLIASAYHGFTFSLPTLSRTTHSIQIYAVDNPAVQPLGTPLLAFGSSPILTQDPPVSFNLTVPTIQAVVISSSFTTISGVAYDPLNPASNAVNLKLQIDNSATLIGPVVASSSNSNVGTYLPGAVGTNHGFVFNLPTLSEGSHTYQILSETSSGVYSTLAASGTLTVPTAFGSIDIYRDGLLQGWAYRPAAGTGPVGLRVDLYKDSSTVSKSYTGIASLNRPDLVNYAPVGSAFHGFSIAIPGADLTSTGNNTFKLYALDGLGGSTLVATQVIGPARGALDIDPNKFSALAVSGWAFCPFLGTGAQSVRMDIQDLSHPENPLIVKRAVTTLERPDVLKAYPDAGTSTVGFQMTNIPGLTFGTYVARLYIEPADNSAAIAVGAAVTFTLDRPTGYVESAAWNNISGWAYSSLQGAQFVDVQIRIDDRAPVLVHASDPRSDLPANNSRIIGTAHGFHYTPPQDLSSGPHTVSISVTDGGQTTILPWVSGVSSTYINPAPVGLVETIDPITRKISGYVSQAVAGNNPVYVKVTISDVGQGTQYFIVPANISRGDLAGTFPYSSNTLHGFSVTIPATLTDSPDPLRDLHVVSVTALDYLPSFSVPSDPSLPTGLIETPLPLKAGVSSSFTLPKTYGSVDNADFNLISGWAFSPSMGSGSVYVKILIDDSNSGTRPFLVLANQDRSDLATPLGSTAHGFSFVPPTDLAPGVHQYHVFILEHPNVADISVKEGFALDTPSMSFVVNSNLKPNVLVSGAAAGDAPMVYVNSQSGLPIMNFLAYDSAFRGGVVVAKGDFTGDGIPDIVTGPVSGLAATVKIFNGVNARVQSTLTAFGTATNPFNGGVSLATGDVNGDGTADIIVGQRSLGSEVRVYNGKDLSLLESFTAYPGFIGGVNVAVGDVNGDGVMEVVTGPGSGQAGLKVGIWTLNPTAKTAAKLKEFDAYTPTFTGGINVAVTHDQHIITSAASAGSWLNIWAWQNGALTPTSVEGLFAAGTEPNGLSVAAWDINADGRDDLIIGSASVSAGHSVLLKVINGTTLDVSNPLVTIDSLQTSLTLPLFSRDLTLEPTKGITVA